MAAVGLVLWISLWSVASFFLWRKGFPVPALACLGGLLVGLAIFWLMARDAGKTSHWAQQLRANLGLNPLLTDHREVTERLKTLFYAQYPKMGTRVRANTILTRATTTFLEHHFYFRLTQGKSIYHADWALQRVYPEKTFQTGRVRLVQDFEVAPQKLGLPNALQEAGYETKSGSEAMPGLMARLMELNNLAPRRWSLYWGQQSVLLVFEQDQVGHGPGLADDGPGAITKYQALMTHLDLIVAQLPEGT